MKRINGFTLIELMIVIAVLGIACGCFFTPLLGLISDMKSNGVEIQRQESLTRAFLLLEKAFGSSTGLSVLSGGEIALSGGSCSAVKREDGGRVLVITSQGVEIRVETNDGIVLGPFQQVDGKTAWCAAQISDARFPMFWRCKK